MIVILALFIIILDQITKFIVTRCFNAFPVEIIKGIFSIDLVHNRGAAFGILQNQTAFFIFISITAIIMIIFLFKGKGALLRISLSLILGGAIGNLIDRIKFGYVIDFLDFKIWPVFNVADSAITIGAGLLVLCILFFSKSGR